MNRWLTFLLLVAAGVTLFPFRSPAPLVYSPGEGWYYEPVGTTAKWTRTRAKDQLEVAEQVRGNFSIAQYYEKNKQWTGAVVYYNEVLQMDPSSPYAAQARQRIEVLKPRMQTPSAS